MSDEQDFFGEEPSEPNNVTDKELASLIDRWLADARPERYEEGEDDWMEPVFVKAREALTRYRAAEDVITDSAQRRVRSREGLAVKQAHAELRLIAKGKVPLGWPTEGEEWTEDGKRNQFYLLHLPLKIGAKKVQFCAMSPQDWKDWFIDSTRLGDEDAQRRIDERAAAAKLARLGTEQNVDRTDAIRWAT